VAMAFWEGDRREVEKIGIGLGRVLLAREDWRRRM